MSIGSIHTVSASSSHV